MYDITVLVPSIRPQLLKGLYDSIDNSFHGSWELVIISPYPLPANLKDKTNIQIIEDWGTPIRARQIGLINSRGTYICYAADDCKFIPNALDESFNLIKDRDYKTVVLGKYSEGMENNPETLKDEYYKLSYHAPHKILMQKMGKDYYFVNTGLISRQFMMELGGFDCQFEACAIACCDLSVRMQNAGATILLQKGGLFNSTHLAGQLGDHKPIHDAQTEHDHPLFYNIYWNRENYNRTSIPIDNWKQAPARWARRFGME